VVDPDASNMGRPMMDGVHETARFVALYGTPACLGLIGLYLVADAFGSGVATGLRSLASVLLPVIIGSFLLAFNRQALQRVAGVPTAIGLLAGLGMGLLVMAALRFFAGSPMPLAELLVSGCFAVLVFSSASETAGRGLAWYYGVMTGLLVYLVFWGTPVGG
jgi:hypothetical protein